MDALRSIAHSFAALLICIISFCSVATLYGDKDVKAALNDARSEIQNAFKALVKAHSSGGEVVELVWGLNEALDLISGAEDLLDVDPEEAIRLSSEAQRLAHNVTLEAPHVEEEGLGRRQVETVILIGSSAGLVFSGAFVYICGPRFFWRIWVRIRKNCRVIVRSSSAKSRGSMLVSGEVWAIFLAVTVIAAVFVSSQLFFGGRVTEAFSELGVLGPRMKIGDYPKEVVAGEVVRLNVHVGNHMGRPIYYVVMVKMGSNETEVDPAPTEPLVRFERVLLENETWIFPADIELAEAGLNRRIILELWMYNETSERVEYHHRWCQIWVNVTAAV